VAKGVYLGGLGGDSGGGVYRSTDLGATWTAGLWRYVEA
jgi:hypothetical protein